MDFKNKSGEMSTAFDEEKDLAVKFLKDAAEQSPNSDLENKIKKIEAQHAINKEYYKNYTLLDYAKMISMLIWILVVFVLSSVFSYFQGILSAHLSQNTVKVMRKDLFDHIVKLPIKYTIHILLCVAITLGRTSTLTNCKAYF